VNLLNQLLALFGSVWSGGREKGTSLGREKGTSLGEGKGDITDIVA
jgi:hypothetical protein